MNLQKKRAQEEREKAALTLPQMIAHLNSHPDRHTPFMDRWASLIIEAGTFIYPVDKPDGVVGKRFLHGAPGKKRVIELVESCRRFGKPNTFFAKLVG
jgi:hypothetical protein